MKRNLQLMMMLAAFGIFFACATSSFAQTTGGYKSVAVDDEAVTAAADFAVSDHSEKNEVSLVVVSILKAERQIVQGRNFRMCIEVKVADEGNDETQYVLAVVYQDLKQNYKLTSWKPDGCGE